MFYQAKATKHGKTWIAQFPDCPGCQTQASSEGELLANAREALEGWLEAHLVSGRVPPKPREHRAALRVDIDPILAVRVQLRQARHEQKLTQGDVAQRAGVTQQQIARLENPDANPTLASLRAVADALGLVLDVRLVA